MAGGARNVCVRSGTVGSCEASRGLAGVEGFGQLRKGPVRMGKVCIGKAGLVCHGLPAHGMTGIGTERKY